MLSQKCIIEKLKQVYNIKTDIQLANKLGSSPAAISQWKNNIREIDLKSGGPQFKSVLRSKRKADET